MEPLDLSDATDKDDLPQLRLAEDFSVPPDSSVLPLSLNDTSLYFNRELSLVQFQRRVLEEAQDETNPLLERFKFLSIIGSNLDEFFMVRVAGLKRQVQSGHIFTGPDGLSPLDQLNAIKVAIAGLVGDAQDCLKNKLLPALEQVNLHITEYQYLSASERVAIRQYFLRKFFPVLTPMAFDPGHPFPHISNLSLNLAVLIRDGKGQERFARVKVPDSLPQLVPVGPAINPRAPIAVRQGSYIWLDNLIAAHLDTLFPGMTILEAHPFHITRDAELEIQELEAGDLLETTEEGIRQRRLGDVVPPAWPGWAGATGKANWRQWDGGRRQ